MKTSSRDGVTIAHDLHSIAIHLLRRVRREDDASGLTAARFSALSALVFGGRKTLGELAAAEQVSLPTMTRIAAALTAAGYVKRSVDDADRRYVYLEAMPRGAALLDAGRRRRVARVAALLTDLDDDELAACDIALGALRRALERQA